MRLDEAILSHVVERERLGYSVAHTRVLRRLLTRLGEGVAERLARERGGKLDERLEPHEPLVVYVTDLTERDLTSLLDVLLARGLSSGSVASVGASLRVFGRFLLRRNLVLLDPARDLVLARVQRRIGYVPSPADVARLLRTASPESALAREGFLSPETEVAAVAAGAPRTVKGRRSLAFAAWKRKRVIAEALRDVAALEILYGSGLRLAELCNLDVTDLDLKERTLQVRSGKGRKDRVVPLTRAASRSLTAYLLEGRPFLFSRKTPALLLMPSGARLSTWWRAGPFRRLIRAAHLPRLTPHRLRHACAVHLVTGGADIVKISRLLGHERLDVTALYLALSPAAIAKTLLAAHPREKQEHRRRARQAR